MKVEDIITELSGLPHDADVVVYTSCGPESVSSVSRNGCGEVVLNGDGVVCEHIIDCECTK